MAESEKKIQFLKDLIRVAKSELQADLIIKNARIVNVLNECIEDGDIAIYKDRIAGIGRYDNAKSIIDAQKSFVTPSLIDSHMHIESTMLIPYELSKALIPEGTTVIIADPHEIANVCGINGIKFLIKNSENLTLDFYFMASSCVPATDFETSGGILDARVLKKLVKERKILGLAEVMNYPDVISGNPQILSKLSLFENKKIDGHCPDLSGKDLNAYISSGIEADHECSNIKEAYEKLSKGMYIMIREGSVTKDLLNLVDLITEKTKHRILLCTDDKHPDDIISHGHINNSINLLINRGISLPVAIRLATLNPAIFFNLKNKGAVAPGFSADLLIFNDITNIKCVIKGGKIVYKNEKNEDSIDILDENINSDNNISKKKYNINKCKSKENILQNDKFEKKVLNTIHLARFNIKDFQVRAYSDKIRVIGCKDKSVLTENLIIEPLIENDYLKSDIKNDIIKISVFERHHKTGIHSNGFIHGIGLKNGAIATSISHDSHNIIIIGENDEDMLVALRQIEIIGGGIVLAKNGKALDYIKLPYAGLMSDKPIAYVARKMEELLKIAKDEIKVRLDDPFMTLSFMSLAVIPELKIVDRGLVDVNEFKLVDLFVY